MTMDLRFSLIQRRGFCQQTSWSSLPTAPQLSVCCLGWWSFYAFLLKEWYIWEDVGNIFPPFWYASSPLLLENAFTGCVHSNWLWTSTCLDLLMRRLIRLMGLWRHQLSRQGAMKHPQTFWSLLPRLFWQTLQKWNNLQEERIWKPSQSTVQQMLQAMRISR